MKPLGITFTWEEWLQRRELLSKGAELFGPARRSWNPNAEKAARRLKQLGEDSLHLDPDRQQTGGNVAQ